MGWVRVTQQWVQAQVASAVDLTRGGPNGEQQSREYTDSSLNTAARDLAEFRQTLGDQVERFVSQKLAHQGALVDSTIQQVKAEMNRLFEQAGILYNQLCPTAR